MAIPVESILDRVQTTLLDEEGVRWTPGELVEWLNDAQRALVSIAPTAYVISIVYDLSPGTRQSLPEDGLRIIDVPRNTNDDGSMGAAVRKADLSILDVYRPDWHSEEGTTVKHFAVDPRDPLVFYIYPGQPSPATGKVTLVYGGVPPEVGFGSDIGVPDVYDGPLVNYILFRALSKDSEDSSTDRARADGYYKKFFEAVSGKSAADAAV